ncbi:MAG: hypothetical protein JWQ18_2592 [Conexibacter sp.]|nr:hypothetical protein [Conexibacter sp.]
MSRPLRTVPVVGLLAVAVSLPTAAVAATPTINSWSGKTKQHKLGVEIVQVAGKAAYLSVQVSCTDPSGMEHAYAFQAHKLPKRGKVKIADAKVPGGFGTVSFSTTLPVKHKAVGTLSYKVAASAGGCAASDRFSLKYAVGHPG